MRHVEHPLDVGVDLQARVPRKQRAHQVAEQLGAGLVHENQHPRPGQVEGELQPCEPAGFVRTRCIVRSGWG